jgi:uncharacterized glyoxalase superfamily protein PhnB
VRTTGRSHFSKPGDATPVSVHPMSTQTIFPALRYHDADAALSWLTQAFGAETVEVHRDAQGRIAHAELKLGDELIMLGTSTEDGLPGARRPDPRAGAISLYVALADPDAAYARAVGSGAEVMRELTDTDYGSREFGVRDLEGHAWSFGTYNPHDR